MSAQAIGVELDGFGWRHRGRHRWAVRDVTFSVRPGERVLLAGASGAGKSTVLRSVAGLADPAAAAESAGRIRYRRDGREISTHAARASSGFLMQDPETNLLMSRVGDDIAFGLENARVPRSEIWPRVDSALRSVGLKYGPDRLTVALSGGEKQRVGIAAMLARRPGLLLLDEPTANLDPQGASEIIASLRDVLDATGVTLIVVEHRLPDVIGLVDRVVVLRPEGVVLDDSPDRAVTEHPDVLGRAGVFVPGANPAAGLPAPARRASALPAIEADCVTVVRGPGEELALDDVSMTAPIAEATAITGPNGAGKSTLARVLGGLLEPTRGMARMPGNSRPLHRLRSGALARHVGSVFQEPEHQFVARTVAAELGIGARAVGASRDDAGRIAAELMDGMGLAELSTANPYTLSGGEKRRLAVAAALAGAPSVLILDEPTFGQDAQTWRAMAEILLRQLDAGRALVVVTHDGPLVSALGAREVHLRQGRRAA